MTQLDPVVAVADVETSSDWYRSAFEFKRTHGGDEFAVLQSDDGIQMCLHKWGEHEHPTMIDPNVTPGNGLILYFRTDRMEVIRQNLRTMNYAVEEEIHTNPNSLKREFSLRDPNGYFLIVSEYHTYEG